MLGLLAFTKDLPRLLNDRRSRNWDHHPVRELQGQRLLVVGLGHIGREVARCARALEMYVIGVRRTPSDSDLFFVDEVRGSSELADIVPGVDAVVLALPGTPETDGLFDADLINALPTHAIVVNVGRGTTIDQDALIDALRRHQLSGAALDVCSTEPPAPDNPLWTWTTCCSARTPPPSRPRRTTGWSTCSWTPEPIPPRPSADQRRRHASLLLTASPQAIQIQVSSTVPSGRGLRRWKRGSVLPGSAPCRCAPCPCGGA